jgi:hypothetical protein
MHNTHPKIKWNDSARGEVINRLVAKTWTLFKSRALIITRCNLFTFSPFQSSKDNCPYLLHSMPFPPYNPLQSLPPFHRPPPKAAYARLHTLHSSPNAHSHPKAMPIFSLTCCAWIKGRFLCFKRCRAIQEGPTARHKDPRQWRRLCLGDGPAPGTYNEILALSDKGLRLANCYHFLVLFFPFPGFLGEPSRSD